MCSIVEALDVLLEHRHLSLLFIYLIWLSVCVLGRFALDVSFEDCFLAVDVKSIDLHRVDVTVEVECVELAALCKYHNLVCVER